VYKQNFKPARTVHWSKLHSTRLNAHQGVGHARSRRKGRLLLGLQAETQIPGDSDSDCTPDFNVSITHFWVQPARYRAPQIHELASGIGHYYICQASTVACVQD